jgi:uncharacterized protein (TIRG00374 family)
MIDGKEAGATASGGFSRLAKLGLGLAITAGCVFLMLKKVSIREIGESLAGLRWRYVLLGVASLAIGYALRILRWKTMLDSAKPETRYSAYIPPFLGSIGMNNILPFRSGDVLRAFVFPASIGIGRTLSLVTLVLERAFDVLVLILFIIAGIFSSASSGYPPWVVPTALFLGASLVAGAAVLFVFGGKLASFLGRKASASGSGLERLASKAAIALAGFLESMRSIIGSGGRMARILAISVLAWLFESGVFLCILLAFGESDYASYAPLVMAIGTLATLVPSSPGYVGPFHLAVSSLLLGLGMSGGVATGYSVVVHLCLWLPTTLAGCLCIALRPELFKAARKPQNPADSEVV